MNYEELSDRELDALVAEKVMGWQWVTLSEKTYAVLTGERFLDAPDSSDFRQGYFVPADTTLPLDKVYHRYVPHYSTDIAAAWLILDKLKDYAIEIRNSHKPGIAPWIVYIGTHLSTSPTPMRAICLAALTVNDRQEKA